jgi:shikimate kinase
LALQLGVPFADTDQLIEAAEGRSVADIFVNSGEDYFRDVEVGTVADALDRCDGVLALGGGAILRSQTQQALARHQVIWLRVTMDTAVRRVGLNAPRPVLLGNVRGKMSTMMAARAPIYEAVASMATIDNDGDDPAQPVAQIAAILGREE